MAHSTGTFHSPCGMMRPTAQLDIHRFRRRASSKMQEKRTD
jgi:hypothetical protein